MKECLWCKKEYPNKRETSKFCSTSCRVMFSRKHGGKKDKVSQTQLQVLYNALLEKVGELKAAQHIATRAPEMLYTAQISQSMTFGQYEQAKIDCELPEQWEALKQRIMLDPHLSSKQKTYLTTKR